MIVLDRTGRVRAMNPAAKRILRVPGAQAGDQPLQDIIQLETEAGVPVPLPDRLPGEATTARGLVSGAGDHRPFVQIRVSPLGARRASADAEGPPNILTPGHQVADAKMGAADVDVAGGPRAAEGLDGYLAEIVDLTAYKESEDAKGAFLAGLSHELKTPLSLIRGYAETLTQASLRDDPALTATALDVILTETQRLTEMVDRLLYAARVQAGELRLEVDEVDLQRLLGRLVDEFRDLHGDYLWVLTPAQVDTVIGDAARLREVFANLLSNAVKFSPQGSLIRIEPTQDGPDVAVSVTDEGIGIDVADQDRVFDRFFRATDKVEGTGLGLFMSRAIVEAHGGSIALRSRLGHGSTFTVRLPRSRGEGAPRGVPAGAPREAPR
jgi:signal transduction histidine kinase